MILVDSSVWIDHLRSNQPGLEPLLENGLVLCHPFVIGELACGTFKDRREFLKQIDQLPLIDAVDHEEALQFLTLHSLAGTGIDWIDVHLLASAKIARAELWTLDKRLAAAARTLRVAATLP